VKTSDAVNELAAALAKAQGQFATVAKNAANPHLRNHYADLSACIDATRPALAANGLCVMQDVAWLAPVDGDKGMHIVLTRLMHESGQWVETGQPLLWEREGKGTNRAQRFGGGMTYARRYGYMAALGLSPDDDDGCSAGQPRNPPRLSRPPQEHPAVGTWVRGELPKGLEDRGNKPWGHPTALAEWLVANDVPLEAYTKWRAAVGRPKLKSDEGYHVGGTWVKLLGGELATVKAWMAEQHGGES